MRIVLTQAEGRLEGLAARLRAAGCDAVRAPLLAVQPQLDGATRAAAEALLGVPWRCYVSRSAVEAWAALGLPFDDGARLAAVGAGSARALVAQAPGRDPNGAPAPAPLTPPAASSTAAGLASALLAAGAGGSVVGLVQGRRARPELAQRLRKGGAVPRSAVVYDVRTLPWQVAGPVDAVLVTSPSAVAALPYEVGERVVVVALGPTTAAAVRERGWPCLQAPRPSTDGVLAAFAALAPQRLCEGVGGWR